jgi:4-amino-4-deoxy-L-arabinose transferase-like glycosyltransferase
MVGRRAAAGRRRACLLAVVGVALAVRSVNLWWMAGHPIAEYQVVWPESDMTTYWRWSARILAGDVLGREPFRPYPSWMQQIAPLETWERWWGGRPVFYNAPLYAYLLAGMRTIAGDRYAGIGLCQLALGLLSVALIFVLAERYFGLGTGVLAGLAAAVYGPFLLHETIFLRDSLGVTLSLLLLWGLSRCTGTRPAPWLGAGVLFGIALLGREVTLLVAPFVVLWIVQRFWGRWAVLATTLASFALGAFVGLLPLIARNLAVGAPPLALSVLGLQSFVYLHAADSWPVGFHIPASAPGILRAADGRLGETVRLTLDTYDSWGQLVRHEATRLSAIFAAHEPMDNVSWYYFVERWPLLRFSLHFPPVLALGLTGAWLGWGRARGDARMLWYFLLASLVALQYAVVIARYRLVPAAVLLIFAGFTLRWLAGEIAGRRWRAALAGATAVAAILALSEGVLGWSARPDRHRAAEFQMAAQVYLRRQQPERAYDDLRVGLETACGEADEPALPQSCWPLAQMLVQIAPPLGRAPDAIALLERMLAAHPADRRLRRLVGALRAGTASPG